MRELLEALGDLELVLELDGRSPWAIGAGDSAINARRIMPELEALWPDELRELCGHVELLELLVAVCRSRQHGREG